MKKVVIVTGGAKGIGLNISNKLIENGYFIIILGRSEKSSIEFPKEFKIDKNFKYLKCDISSPEDRLEVLNYIKSNNLNIYSLINNASIGPNPRKDILECSENSFNEILSNNLVGPFFLTQELVNYMISNKLEGTLNYVINISSISSFVVSNDRAEYCISKAAFSMSSKLWAAKLGEFGFQVFDIQPGIIKKQFNYKESFSEFDYESENELSVMKRWGISADISTLIDSILNGGLPYVTGSPIIIDGGMHIKRL